MATNKVNVVVVGDTSVGKTCLLLRYTEDIFRENMLSTLGIDYKVKHVNVDKKSIKLQLWDTAGQERFHSLVQGFYRGAKVISYDIESARSVVLIRDTVEVSSVQSAAKEMFGTPECGILVVYDITNKVSFQNVSIWLDNISANTNETVCPVLGVIGNKSDLNFVRQVERETGEELAKRVGATFGEVSAKTGDGIDEVFQVFLKHLMVQIDNDVLMNDTVTVSNNLTTNKQRCCLKH